jgi:hypothetical protein
VEDTDTTPYDQHLQKLLEQIAQGRSWGEVQGFMIGQGISKDKLAHWLQRSGTTWLAQQDSPAPVALQLLDLGQMARGELGSAATAQAQAWISTMSPPDPDGLQAPDIFRQAIAKTNPPAP